MDSSTYTGRFIWQKRGGYGIDPLGSLRDSPLHVLNFDGAVAGHFVVVDGGKEIFNISLRPGNSVIGVFRKMD